MGVREQLLQAVRAACVRRRDLSEDKFGYNTMMINFIDSDEAPDAWVHWPFLFKLGKHALPNLSEYEEDPYEL